MPITKDGLITGGRVTNSGGFFTSREYRKANKMKMLDKAFVFFGVGMIASGFIILLGPSHIVVTAATGFTDNNSRFSTSTFNFILGFYDIFIGFLAQWVTLKHRKRIILGSFFVLAFAIFISFNSIFDPPSLKYDEWAKERYGITQIEKSTSENDLVPYKVGEEEKIAEVRHTEGKTFLYNPDTDTELPQLGK